MKFDDTKHPDLRATNALGMHREMGGCSDCREPFRTASGQTGKDAYTFELAQIRNQHRDLKERLNRLTETMAAELPEDAASAHRLGSMTSEVDVDTIRRMLPMFTLDDMSLEDLTYLTRNLKSESF